MKGLKSFSILIFFLVGVLVCSSVYGLSSSDINILKVEANNVELSTSTPKSVKVTDNIDILVVFDSNINTSNIQVEAVLRGYEYKDFIEDISDVFEVISGNRYDTRLDLEIPKRLEQGRYDLKIRFDDRTGGAYEVTYPLDIGAARHALQIKDVIFDPENEQKANRAILTKVRIRNYGESDEEGIKVKVSIPQLGISASDYIDEIESGDSVTSVELYMKLPSEIKTGQYTVVVGVEYHDGEKVEDGEFTYRIIGSEEKEGKEEEILEPKTIVTISQETQEATAGVGGVVYPITITNKGSEARTYVVEVDGVDDWGSSKITPSNIVLVEGGETKAAYVYISAKESASAGEYMFSVSIKSDEAVLKQIPLKTKVASTAVKPRLISRPTLVKALQVGLVTFVVLLVILGLIIGFTKLRGEEVEEPEEGSEKYY